MGVVDPLGGAFVDDKSWCAIHVEDELDERGVPVCLE